MPATRLEVKGLSAGYGPTRVIDHMSFEVLPGGRLSVLGRNGVGKTTLLASLMGLTTHHGGKVFLGEADLTDSKASTRAQRGLGYVPQLSLIHI